jgi:hypothetical protein
MKEFRTRKEQIEKDFLGRLMRDLKRDGCTLTRKARSLIREELKSAAMVGAVEERRRTLKILQTYDSSVAAHKIVGESVLQVLGYE